MLAICALLSTVLEALAGRAGGETCLTGAGTLAVAGCGCGATEVVGSAGA